MGTRTSYEPGTFCWVELGTSDASAAADFYAAILVWQVEQMESGIGTYRVAQVQGATVAGIYKKQSEHTPSAWLAYVSVEDVDLTAKSAESLGATLVTQPCDVSELGRMAVVQDPGGAVFGLWQPNEMVGAQLVNDAGAFTSTQLVTGDPQQAMEFYTDLFGWKVVEMPGGEPYWSFNVGERMNAGLMQNLDAAPDYWAVYFTTADLDAALHNTSIGGGHIVLPATAIGSGRRIAVAQDPQGAVFALYEGDVDN